MISKPFQYKWIYKENRKTFITKNKNNKKIILSKKNTENTRKYE